MSASELLMTLRAVRMALPVGSLRIDMSVHGGERLAILGPEGIGKSRLLRLMAGLTLPESGSVIRHDAGHVLGVLFRVPELRFLCVTPREEVGLAPASRGLSGDLLLERVERALSRAGLNKQHWDQPWHTFSAAEKYRLGMAILYALQPHVLLIDEPGNPLSDAGEAAFSEGLRHYCREQGAALVVFTSRMMRARLFGERVMRIVALDGNWGLVEGGES
ncbi:MAG: ATP-binding cassette domain-containing protein [Magnetococcales bacterium]|nr:ATP-binding cassette domain-containing protein [Magnetococcales bacterium]